MTTFIRQTDSVAQTQQLASSLAKHLTLPAVLAISGQLGAGKTHFIKGLGQGLGIDPQKICSATFVIIAEYGQEKRLIHIDAYRLSNPNELESIGWYELLDQPNTLLAVEWAEKITPLLPSQRLDIQIDILDDHRRKFTFTPHGQLYESAL
ncbi:MAG: tRNA (adenosine(37)-N6)-threonylcarbamoyltransferase complex ATPase subunit type 1 TsaE [Phycisphaerae bacterium]